MHDFETETEHAVIQQIYVHLQACVSFVGCIYRKRKQQPGNKAHCIFNFFSYFPLKLKSKQMSYLLSYGKQMITTAPADGGCRPDF